MSHLSVTRVPTVLVWEDPGTDRTRFDARLTSRVGAADLVLLPEMVRTGLTTAGVARCGHLAGRAGGGRAAEVILAAAGPPPWQKYFP